VSVIAKRVTDIDAADVPPSAFEFFSDATRPIAGMIYNCPCGCGRRGALEFRPHPSPSWDWNGDKESPTLNPSVHHIIGDQTHFHGWLRAGVWESC